MSDVIDVDGYIRALEIQREESSKWNLPENGQKPCLMGILRQDTPIGTRNITFHILACDFLNRQNIDMLSVEKMLCHRNLLLSDPLLEKEIKGIIKSAAKKRVTYGCNSHPLILGNCVGKEVCPFYKQSFSKENNKRSESLYALMDKGWLSILGGNEFKLYAGICKLERIKCVSPGSQLIVTHRELSKITGASRPTIAEGLMYLHLNHALIYYEKGKRHLKYRTASTIRRTIPIPYFMRSKYLPKAGKEIYHYYKTSKKMNTMIQANEYLHSLKSNMVKKYA
jgi:hypothetical protein